MRARQFEKRDERFREAIARTIRLRHENKDYFDDSKVIRDTRFATGDLVLIRDSFYDTDRSTLTKFLPKWKGPFRIKKVGEKNWYTLEELDGTPFRRHTPGNRLKKFHQRTVVDLEEADRHYAEEEAARLSNEARSTTANQEEEPTPAPLDLPYSQDIPNKPSELVSEALPRCSLRSRAPLPQEETEPVRKQEEEEDLVRASHKPRRLVPMLPRRERDFNPSEVRVIRS
jgi:hypothetical protein